MAPKQYRIAVDFDGTIVEHDFPDIGPAVPGAVEWLKRWQAAGAMLILWTMRSALERDGDVLAAAITWCLEHGLDFDAVNYGPGDIEWTFSPKAYAHCYVDDAAFGCPLVESARMGGRPYADWEKIGPAVLAEIEKYEGRWAPREVTKAGSAEEGA